MLSKEHYKALVRTYINSLPSPKTKKAVERIKKVKLLQVYPHPQNPNVSVIIAGSPKLVKDEFGNIQKGVSIHRVELNLKKKAIKCSCPYFKKNKICKHTLKVLLILTTQQPTYLFRRIIYPNYKANREKAYATERV